MPCQHTGTIRVGPEMYHYRLDVDGEKVTAHKVIKIGSGEVELTPELKAAIEADIQRQEAKRK